MAMVMSPDNDESIRYYQVKIRKLTNQLRQLPLVTLAWMVVSFAVYITIMALSRYVLSLSQSYEVHAFTFGGWAVWRVGFIVHTALGWIWLVVRHRRLHRVLAFHQSHLARHYATRLSKQRRQFLPTMATVVKRPAENDHASALS